MKKIICNANGCANKGVNYFMPIEDEKVMCGGCKVWLDAITMTDAEIAATFDYDFNASSTLGQQSTQSGGN
jgi:hypothetical protein